MSMMQNFNTLPRGSLLDMTVRTSVDRALYLAQFFFFFQAEDGIRDRTVTGVQTCALPISKEALSVIESDRDLQSVLVDDRLYSLAKNGSNSKKKLQMSALELVQRITRFRPRSEERRVGKECRSRWWTEHEKKKQRMSTMSS